MSKQKKALPDKALLKRYLAGESRTVLVKEYGEFNTHVLMRLADLDPTTMGDRKSWASKQSKQRQAAVEKKQPPKVKAPKKEKTGRSDGRWVDGTGVERITNGVTKGSKLVKLHGETFFRLTDGRMFKEARANQRCDAIVTSTDGLTARYLLVTDPEVAAAFENDGKAVASAKSSSKLVQAAAQVASKKATRELAKRETAKKKDKAAKKALVVKKQMMFTPAPKPSSKRK
jgi:hypothetical protein